MQIKSKPIVQEFPLKTDKDGIATVTIRQATFGQDKLRSDAFATSRTLWQPGVGTVIEQNRNIARIYAKEIYAVIVGATGFLDEDRKEMFAFKDGKLAMTEGEFYEQLDRLDGDMVREISDCVYKVNPTWGVPSDASEQKKTQAESDKDKEEKGEEDTEGESQATSA